MKPGRVLGPAVLVTLGLFFVAAGPARADAGVEAMVKAFFVAAAQGDLATVQKLATGRVLQDARRLLPTDERAVNRMKQVADAFSGLGPIEVKGDRAVVEARFSAARLFGRIESSYLIGAFRSGAEMARDQERKKALILRAENLERGVLTVRVVLVKRGGKWLVSGLD